MKRKQSKLITWHGNQLGSSPISKRPKKKKTTTTISDLPGEVLTEVLIRLSIKDILACVRVQRSWYSLIKTRVFINLYSNYHQKISSSSYPNNNKYLLFWNTHTRSYEIRVDDIQCKKYITLKFPAGLSNHFNYQLVSNGLICLFNLRVRKTRVKIYLWNPVIEKYITLPRSPQRPSSCRFIRWKAIAFGFVQENNDYVVVYMAKYSLKNKRHTHHIITWVYNLSTNSWKQITHNNTRIRMTCQSEGIIVNGIAVWIGHNSHMDRILVCFDTRTKMLRKILSPKTLEWPPVIHAFDQSIVYFVEKRKDFNEHHMWILKGDPMNEFVWEKKMIIREKAFVPAFLRNNGVLGLRNNGEPILRKSFDLISYNLDSLRSYDFLKTWHTCKFKSDRWGSNRLCGNHLVMLSFVIKPFAESLGLLDIETTKKFRQKPR